MALFLGVHKLPSEMKEEELVESFDKYKETAKAKGITALSAVYSMEKGFAYCQTEADSAEQVKEAHADAEVPIDDVIEIKPM